MQVELGGEDATRQCPRCEDCECEAAEREEELGRRVIEQVVDRGLGVPVD